MPSGRSRRKPDNGSSPDSKKRELYEQLFRFLEQGGEALATSDEYQYWIREWTAAHPGERVPLLADPMPWAIQRQQALGFLRALTWETWLRLEQTRHEMEQAEREEAGAPVGPFDVERARAEWREWRDELIQRYRLGGLVAEEK